MKVMKATYQTGTGLVLLMALLLGACTADDANDKKGVERQLHISLASNAYQDDGSGMTRGLPTGYEVLDVSTAFPNGKDMLAFIAHSTNSSEVLIRRLEYKTDWQQNITVTDYSTPYCIYGFVPISDDTSDNASIRLLDDKTSYADGVKMVISNLKPLTASDPCVIVGAKDCGTATDINDVDIKLGTFNYAFSQNATSDKICMLLDHLYAKFHFKIAVSASYAALRTIKVKKVQLEALDASDNVIKAVTATVDIVANTGENNPISSITFSKTTTGSVTPFILNNDETPLVLTTVAQDIGTCLAPYDQQRFRLTTDYEVYDKPTDSYVEPQLLKTHTGVTNKFTATIAADKKKRGFEHTVTITVNPTYLQVLSDNDLEPPTITVN